MQPFKQWIKTCWCLPWTFAGPALHGWQPGVGGWLGWGTLQLVRRLWRMAAKRLPVFAQLICKRLGAREGSLPWPSFCLRLSQQNWGMGQSQETMLTSHTETVYCSCTEGTDSLLLSHSDILTQSRSDHYDNV